MSVHRELFNDLPPAEVLEKSYAGAFTNVRNADGFYNLVQNIAEVYGEQAYTLAEEIFREYGMTFDPAALRQVDSVRRVGYNFDGANIYQIHVQPYQPEMAGEVVRLHNQQIRLLGKAALLDKAAFETEIAPGANDGLLCAFDGGNGMVGFVDCRVESGVGYVEALVFSHGRIYDPASSALVAAAKDYFSQKGVKQIVVLKGEANYPFYKVCGEAERLALFTEKLPHIARRLAELAA